MRDHFYFKKRLILSLVILLVAADLALSVYAWKLASGRTAQQDLVLLTRDRDLLKKDIQRAEDIRRRIPATQKDCDAFEQSLFPEVSGYSTITAELGALAAKSGLRLESRSFSPEKVKGREKLTQLRIEAQVQGNYRNVVSFLNGLQRSPNYYAVEGLSAHSDRQGSRDVRVSVHIRTYLRAV